jgi:hypothetical protein
MVMLIRVTEGLAQEAQRADILVPLPDGVAVVPHRGVYELDRPNGRIT